MNVEKQIEDMQGTIHTWMVETKVLNDKYDNLIRRVDALEKRVEGLG